MHKWRQGKVWRYLRKHPWSSNREMMEALGLTRSQLGGALQQMRKDGTIEHNGLWREFCRWRATDKQPVCRWGQHANSLAAIKQYQYRWPETLTMANRARGFDCVVISPTHHGQNRVQRVRERAPAKSVQIPTLAQLLGVDEAA